MANSAIKYVDIHASLICSCPRFLVDFLVGFISRPPNVVSLGLKIGSLHHSIYIDCDCGTKCMKKKNM